MEERQSRKEKGLTYDLVDGLDSPGQEGIGNLEPVSRPVFVLLLYLPYYLKSGIIFRMDDIVEHYKASSKS